jgi:hypothetical protein
VVVDREDGDDDDERTNEKEATERMSFPFSSSFPSVVFHQQCNRRGGSAGGRRPDEFNIAERHFVLFSFTCTIEEEKEEEKEDDDDGEK